MLFGKFIIFHFCYVTQYPYYITFHLISAFHK